MEFAVQREKGISEKLHEIFEHKNLDVHLHDENYLIRYAVCETGFGLDVLLYDSEAVIRRQVAMQQYGLDRLIYDGDEWVRAAVAQQGFGLEILLHDESKHVRDTAERMLKERESKTDFAEQIYQAECKPTDRFRVVLSQRGSNHYDENTL